MHLTILFIFITLLNGCGNKSSKGNSSIMATQQNGNEDENILSKGKYRALLRPINTAVYGMINSGKALITITGETMKVNLIMDDAPKVPHMQGIHEGSKCPELSADLNGDQFIDILEENAVSGGILIPLDGDISSQAGLKNQYPIGGSYTYNKEAGIKNIMNDLWVDDPDQQDLIIKVNPGSQFSIQNKVIIIRGAPTQLQLPPSVQSLSNLDPLASIPIACGIIEKIE